MKIYSQTLAPGVPWRFNGVGSYLRVISGTGPMDILMMAGGRMLAEAGAVVAGFGMKVEDFNYISITSATAQTVYIAVSEFQIDYVPTSLIVSFVQASGITDAAPVSVGVAATALVAADANRKGVRFYNAGTATVYIGSSAVTTANGAIRLDPGAVWVETDAAPAAWYGISGTAAQSVRVQTVQ